MDFIISIIPEKLKLNKKSLAILYLILSFASLILTIYRFADSAIFQGLIGLVGFGFLLIIGIKYWKESKS